MLYNNFIKKTSLVYERQYMEIRNYKGLYSLLSRYLSFTLNTLFYLALTGICIDRYDVLADVYRILQYARLANNYFETKRRDKI